MYYKYLVFCIQCIIFNELLLSRCYAFIGREVKVAKSTDYLNVVSIVQFENQTRENEDLLCTATLITNQHILTAEHCFLTLINVHVEVILRIRRRGIHERRFIQWWLSYNQWAVAYSRSMQHVVNDIAVVKLHEAVPDSILPAPISNRQPSQLADKKVKAVGYGSGNAPPNLTLTKANLKIMSNAECNEFVSQRQNVSLQIPDILLCSIARPFIISISGDSGGPVFYHNAIVGIHYACVPELSDILNSYKTNLHVGIPYYREFIEFSMQQV